MATALKSMASEPLDFASYLVLKRRDQASGCADFSEAPLVRTQYDGRVVMVGG